MKLIPICFKSFILAMIFLVVAAHTAACAPTLSGRLVSKSGDPIAATDGTVNITRLTKGSINKSKQEIHVVELTGSGEFKTSLGPGTYLVETFIPDYSTVSQRVIFETSSLELRFVLERLPLVKPRAVGANLEVDAARGAGAATLTPPQL